MLLSVIVLGVGIVLPVWERIVASKALSLWLAMGVPSLVIGHLVIGHLVVVRLQQPSR